MPSVSSYLAYKNVRYHTHKRDLSASFVPVAPCVIGFENKCQWVKAPRMSTTNLDQPMYGHSFLFVKPLNFSTTMSLIAVMTATIEFYTYNGNNGVAATTEYTKEMVLRQNKQLYTLHD